MVNRKNNTKMNKIYQRWLGGGALLLAGGLLALVSCTDDHFTIDSEVASRTTIWENISSNDELSEYADILSRVYFSSSKGTTTSQTYADLLNGDQTFTVWAPANGTFDYEAWDELLGYGLVDSTYRVEVELIRNQMTRFAHVLSGSDSTLLDLFNAKTAMFNCATATLDGVPITTSNIASTNGVLHITDGTVEYLPNIYEYLGYNGLGIDSLSSFILGFETTEFDEDASTQGPTVDGNITWVDSITYLSNSYLQGYYLNASLDSEDSTYVMIMPTNAAWSTAYSQIAPYYNYMAEYIQTITSTSSDGTETSETVTTTYTDEELDSITHFRICDVICRNLVFNTTEQTGLTWSQYSVEGACDSLVSTYGQSFYDPYSARLFAGAEPVELSNGYAYIVDAFNYRAEDAWVYELEYEAERNYITYGSCTPSSEKISYDYTYIPDSNYMDVTKDTTITETVLRLSPTRSTANSEVTLRLANTLAGTYDIYALMAYNVDADRPYQLRFYINYHEGTTSKTTRTRLSPIEGVNGSGNNFVSKAPHVDENGQFHFNDSILIAEDFELPVCYYGLDDAYVTLEIQSYMTSSQRTTYTNEVLIDKVVMVPKTTTDEE